VVLQEGGVQDEFSSPDEPFIGLLPGHGLELWFIYLKVSVKSTKQQFLLRDENNYKLNFFSYKVFINANENDFKEAGKLFESMEDVRGIGPTNSSKILHLFAPDFFVM